MEGQFFVYSNNRVDKMKDKKYVITNRRVQYLMNAEWETNTKTWGRRCRQNGLVGLL